MRLTSMLDVSFLENSILGCCFVRHPLEKVGLSRPGRIEGDSNMGFRV